MLRPICRTAASGSPRFYRGLRRAGRDQMLAAMAAARRDPPQPLFMGNCRAEGCVCHPLSAGCYSDGRSVANPNYEGINKSPVVMPGLCRRPGQDRLD